MHALLKRALAHAALLALAGALVVPVHPALASQVSCGAVLTENTKLDRDLTNCSGDGLIIGADHITVSLNGHSITGTGAAGSAGIRNIGHDRVTIQDGDFSGLDIEGFEIGILLQDAHNNRVRRIFVEGSAFGIQLTASDHNDVSNNTARSLSAIQCDVVAYAGIALFDSDDNQIRENETHPSTDFGIALVNSHHNRVEKNGASPIDSDGNNCSGIALFDSNENKIENNIAAENRENGILVGFGSHGNLVARNLAFRNAADGIHVNDPATTIKHNTTNTNGNLGIFAVPGVIDGGGNRAQDNGNPAQCLNVECST